MTPRPTSRPTLRAAVSVGLLSAWLVLLMAGFAWGGAVHLLFVASLVVFPWRALRLPVHEPSSSADPDPVRDGGSGSGGGTPSETPSHSRETPS